MARNIIRRYILALLLLIPFTDVQGQVWPTQVNTIIVPPYSPFTGDYVNTPGKMIINLLLRDVHVSDIKVKLRINIEGQGTGVRLTTNPQANVPIITLDGGIPLRLSDADLAPYFKVENLICSGITPAQYNSGGGKLPEDLYKICFEVYEVFTGARISVSNGCGNAWIILNDPPFLNTPGNGVNVPVRNPGVVTFQWTPRHKGSPNAAFSTTYLFQLVELMPGSYTNPQAAFLSSIPLYETTTSSTTLVYGMMGEVPLEPGRQYAWRVKAKSISGVQEMDLFKNQGFSEIYTFNYAGDCPMPAKITAKANGNTRIEINWQSADSKQSEFVVSYRKAGVANASWFEEKTTGTSITLFDLTPAVTYEYRVRAGCGMEGESAFTNADTVSTPAETPVAYTCGAIPPDQSIANQEPLPMLKARDEITASRFKVKLITVEGSNGIYSGTGYIAVPFLNNSRIEVSFKNILVNTDYQLAKGEIITAYDPKWGGINDLDKYFEGGGNTGQVKTGEDSADIEVDFVIPSAESITVKLTPGDSTITIRGDGSNVVSKKVENLPVTIKDSAGNIYKVDENGTVTKIATGGSFSLPSAAERNQLHPELGVVTFLSHKDQTYAFDAYRQEYARSQIFGGSYEKLSDTYSVSAKAIGAGKTDVVTAKITVADAKKMNADSVKFVTGTGTQFVSERMTDGNYKISLLGGPVNDAQELFAVVKQADGKSVTLGKLLISSYGQLHMKVMLIPVNGDPVNKDAIAATLNKIYNPLCIDWEVSIDAPFTDSRWKLDGDELLDVGSGGLLENSTREMQELSRTYAETHPPAANTAYLFILGNGKDKDKLIAGDMPRTKQFGYLFTNGATNIGQTAAHELGHGVFHLKHTFDGYGFGDNELKDNLMSYHNGEQFTKFQWDAVHDPGVVWGVFESSGDAQQQKVRIEELIKFLKDNKGKITAFDQRNYFIASMDAGSGRKQVFKNTINLQGKDRYLYADVYGNGDLDLSRGSDGLPNALGVAIKIPSLSEGEELSVGKMSIPQKVDEDRSLFYVAFYYKGIKDYPAVQFYTYSWSDYKILMTELGLNVNDYKQNILSLYKRAFQLAGDDCNKLDILYENIPEFVLEEIDDETKWSQLKVLLSCRVDDMFTNEQKAILNLLNGFNDKHKLIKKFLTNPAIPYEIWDKFGSGKDIDSFAAFIVKIVSNEWPQDVKVADGKFVYWGGGFVEMRQGRGAAEKPMITATENRTTGNLRLRNYFGRWTLMAAPQESAVLICDTTYGMFEPVKMIFDSNDDQIAVVPAFYLYHLSRNEEAQETTKSLTLMLSLVGGISSTRILLLRNAPKALRIVSAVQLAKTPVDHVLGDDDIRKKLSETENGRAFLSTWAVISPILDITLISADLLLTFQKTAPAARQLLAKEGHAAEADRILEIEKRIASHLDEAADAAVAATRAENAAFDLAAEKAKPGFTPLKAGDNDLVKCTLDELKKHQVIPKPSQGSIKDLIDDIMRNGDGGPKSEQLMDLMMDAKGYQKLDGSYRSKNGLDGIYIPKGQTVETATEFIITESKQLTSSKLASPDLVRGTSFGPAPDGGFSLNRADVPNKLPVQMSDDWILNQANKIRNLEATADNAPRIALGNKLIDVMATRRNIVHKFVMAVDKSTGTTYVAKLATY